MKKTLSIFIAIIIFILSGCDPSITRVGFVKGTAFTSLFALRSAYISG